MTSLEPYEAKPRTDREGSLTDLEIEHTIALLCVSIVKKLAAFFLLIVGGPLVR